MILSKKNQHIDFAQYRKKKQRKENTSDSSERQDCRFFNRPL